MVLEIREVIGKKDLKSFVEYPLRLYAHCPYFVPPLLTDEYESFNRKKNPVFEIADCGLFLAWRDAQVVGRVAALVNFERNRLHSARNVSFAWFDSIDDFDVARGLFDAVAQWGFARGLNTIVGPEGFDGFGVTGMLVEGFDELPTMANPYNYAYYPALMEQCCFTKKTDLVEFRLRNLCRTPFPPRLKAIAERVTRLGGIRLLEFTRKKDLLVRAHEVMDLLEDTYRELDGFVPLTERQKKYYIKKFFPYLKCELVKAVVNKNNQVVSFMIAIPSLSRALQQARGRLFPFGFYHLLKASGRANKEIDFVLGGVRKEYRGRGADLLLAIAMHATAVTLGIENAETNPELEDNLRIQSEWKHYDTVQHKRRRIYRRSIPSP